MSFYATLRALCSRQIIRKFHDLFGNCVLSMTICSVFTCPFYVLIHASYELKWWVLVWEFAYVWERNWDRQRERATAIEGGRKMVLLAFVSVIAMPLNLSFVKCKNKKTILSSICKNAWKWKPLIALNQQRILIRPLMKPRLDRGKTQSSTWCWVVIGWSYLQIHRLHWNVADFVERERLKSTTWFVVDFTER